MIKIVATIHDATTAANIGGAVESISEVIEVPTKNIPPNLKRFIEDRKNAIIKNKWFCETITFSLLEDEI